MKKLGIRGRRWLKAFHVLFSMTWIGAGITTTIIPFVTGNTTSGAELYAHHTLCSPLWYYRLTPLLADSLGFFQVLVSCYPIGGLDCGNRDWNSLSRSME